jgi:hypothetical protein
MLLLPTRERTLLKQHTPVPVWVAPFPILLLLRLADALYALPSSCLTLHHSEKAHTR